MAHGSAKSLCCAPFPGISLIVLFDNNNFVFFSASPPPPMMCALVFSSFFPSPATMFHTVKLNAKHCRWCNRMNARTEPRFRYYLFFMPLPFAVHSDLDFIQSTHSVRTCHRGSSKSTAHELILWHYSLLYFSIYK